MPARIQLKRALSAIKGLSPPKPARKRTKRLHPDREQQFRVMWEKMAPADSIPPEAQYLFHETRKWRFDFAWPHCRLAVEIDGGIFQGKATGHRSITGVTKQMEKLNAAAIDGWCVLRYHANDLDQRPVQLIKELSDLIAWRHAYVPPLAADSEHASTE